MKFRALTYNVHKLFNVTRSRYFLSDLKNALSVLDLDFVFLQEMRGLQPKSHQHLYPADPLEYLADDLWDDFAYGKNAIYSSGDHGNAILSKFPIIRWENHDISNYFLEKRGLLLADVQLSDSKTIFLACSHFDLTHLGRKRQTLKSLDIIKNRVKNEHVLLFAGDFNDWRGGVSKKISESNLFQSMSSAGDRSKKYTFPSKMPFLELDKIFVSPKADIDSLCVLSGEPWSHLSDHLPLLIEINYDVEG